MAQMNLTLTIHRKWWVKPSLLFAVIWCTCRLPFPRDWFSNLIAKKGFKLSSASDKRKYPTDGF